MIRLRTAARATVVVQLFNWSGLVLSLVTVPLYLQWLGQERYGLLLTSLAILSYLMFADAGLNTASMILIAQAAGQNDRVKIASIFRNSCTLGLVSTTAVGIVILPVMLWPQCQLWDTWFPDHPEFPSLWLAIGASAAVSLLAGPVYNLMIGMQDTPLAAMLQGLGRIFGTLLAIGFAWWGCSVGVVFSGNVVAALAMALIAWIISRKRYPWINLSGHYWQYDDIRQQLRTGLKSFAGRMGTVLAGTAPILAISSVAGASFVPLYSIPLTLLNAPLSVFLTLSAVLQPAFGEAKGMGQVSWIADTILGLRRQLLLALGFLGCGFILLASRFIDLWTGGEVSVPHAMLLSVLGIAGLQAILALDRFTLVGMNLHRGAAVADIACGIVCIATGGWIVSVGGPSSIGLGIVVGSLATIGWFLPNSLQRHLRGQSVLPPLAYWTRWILVQAITYTSGWWILAGLSGVPTWIQVAVTGVAIVVVYAAASLVLLRDDMALLEQEVRRWFRRVRITTAEPNSVPCG